MGTQIVYMGGLLAVCLLSVRLQHELAVVAISLRLNHHNSYYDIMKCNQRVGALREEQNSVHRCGCGCSALDYSVRKRSTSSLKSRVTLLSICRRMLRSLFKQ
jgi:hypothetical protein